MAVTLSSWGHAPSKVVDTKGAESSQDSGSCLLANVGAEEGHQATALLETSSLFIFSPKRDCVVGFDVNRADQEHPVNFLSIR